MHALFGRANRHRLAKNLRPAARPHQRREPSQFTARNPLSASAAGTLQRALARKCAPLGVKAYGAFVAAARLEWLDKRARAQSRLHGGCHPQDLAMQLTSPVGCERALPTSSVTPPERPLSIHRPRKPDAVCSLRHGGDILQSGSSTASFRILSSTDAATPAPIVGPSQRVCCG
ncbi:hypothetical protein PSPO01_15179 [Paraphaeosphaeria sporulosa]